MPKPDADEEQGSQSGMQWTCDVTQNDCFNTGLPHLTTELDWRWKADLNWAGFLMLLQRILLVSLGLSLEWRRYKPSCFGAIHQCVRKTRCSEVEKKCHLGCWWRPVPSKSWVAFDPKLIQLLAIKEIWPTYIKLPGTVRRYKQMSKLCQSAKKPASGFLLEPSHCCAVRNSFCHAIVKVSK